MTAEMILVLKCNHLHCTRRCMSMNGNSQQDLRQHAERNGWKTNPYSDEDYCPDHRSEASGGWAP